MTAEPRTSRSISMHVHSFGLRFHFLHEPGFDVFQFIELAGEQGFTGVNVSANGPGFRDLGGTTDAHLARVRDHLGSHDLRCELDTSDTRVEHMTRMLRVAAAIGADRLRTYTRYRGDLVDVIAKTVGDLQTLAPLASELGVTILLENHEDFKGAAIAHILAAVDHPNVRALYDYGNAQMVGEDPLDALDAMLPYTASVHIKDHVLIRDADGTAVQGVPVGQGRLPILQQTEILYAGGLRRFCFENVWGYVAPLIADPMNLPDSPSFLLDHRQVRNDAGCRGRAESVTLERVAFDAGWSWLRGELGRAGFRIERESGDSSTVVP